jgi:transcriptional regulator with GAF, ATPase, and Fis domain
MPEEGQQPAAGRRGGFEALLASIASRLLGAPLDAFDACITEALLGLVEFLGVERATLFLVDPIDGGMRVSHAAALPGVSHVPVGTSSLNLTWMAEQIREKRVPVIFSREADLPPEAAADLRTLRGFGVRSAAGFPMAAGGRLLGAVSFGTSRMECSWPQPVIDRLRLIGEVFAGAFLRCEHERRLGASLAEVEALRERLQAENEYLRERTFAAEGFEDIVGESPALRSVLFQAEQVAPTDATVLLLGETGTGKELIAKAIHTKSPRRDRALVTVNCAALPPTLIESELFGHEKGAFTGATARKIGRFELADRSTLFLDEVGELPLALQAKLLRVLQEGEFERVGSAATQKVDVRVIAASNRDLAAAARESGFRSDLYYRLRVFPIEVPPLRARKEDIPLLVWYFLGQLGNALGRRIERVPAPTMERLVRYDWPGNVRELRSVLERALILSPGPSLLLEELGDTMRTEPAARGSEAGSPRPLADVERDHILWALESCHWRVRGPGNAAEALGLNASTLYSRMKKLGIRRSTGGRRRGTGGRGAGIAG